MEKKSYLVEGTDFREIFGRLIIAMSIHYLSSLTEYYISGIPEFAKVMPKKRLKDKYIYLHPDDNS